MKKTSTVEIFFIYAFAVAADFAIELAFFFCVLMQLAHMATCLPFIQRL